MKILGLDPGGTTGWAYYDNGEFFHGVIPDGLQGLKKVKDRLMLDDSDIVVIEDFVVEPGFVGRPEASEIIGAVEMLCEIMGVPTTRQLRSKKATLIKGTETERFNWLRDHGFDGMTHELDAVTHILLYLRRVEHIDTIKKYWL